MLEHLEIKNFALIENLSVDFHDGFNVITGETGAGKSIILGALGLLMGEKAEASAIRSGADEITVNAVISIPEKHEILPWLKERNVYPEDNAIIVKRVVKLNGRSVIYVQNQLFTRADLTYLADSLIDMHGQSEHQSLLLSDRQRKIVDSYAGNEGLLNSIRQSYNNISELKQKIEENRKLTEEGQKNRDYLSFVCEEISSARIQPNEDEELKNKVNAVSQYEQIYENLLSSVNKLKDSRSIFHDSQSTLAKAAKFDNSLAELSARLESSRIDIEDIGNELSLYLEKMDFSEDAINNMQERLALLQKLKRKYGPTLDDVVKMGIDAQERLNTCRDSQIVLENLNKELEEELDRYRKFSSELSSERQCAASDLQAKIEETLKTLGMPSAVFRIDVLSDIEKISVNGYDTIDFMISANIGEPVKELKLIASGGELSRVMLALKTVLAGSDSIQTQVFDEVDSGIGGAVALSLAKCISRLSKQKQVIAITHLAGIASIADSHFVVCKTVSDGKTYSNLSHVSGEQRVHEIARMLAGDESDVSLAHARLMLDSNSQK